jgi:hypothetical protein
MRNAYKILVGKPEGKKPLARPRVGGKIILELILKKYGRLDASGSGQVPIPGSCEHSNETSVSIKGGVFLD